MQIREGGYYRRRDGQVVGPMRSIDLTRYMPCGNTLSIQESPADLIAEVFVSDQPIPQPVKLEAGKKYETVKPDGTPGPVVELHQPSFSVEGIRDYFCFSSAIKNDTLYITAGGLCVGNCEPGNRYQITREYVEPKPPSLAERLESLKQRTLGGGDIPELHSEFASLVADVRKLEASK